MAASPSARSMYGTNWGGRAAARGRLRRSWDKYWYAWAMVAPVVIVLGVLIFYPLARGIFISFTNLTEANQLGEICTRSITGAEECQPNPNAWTVIGLDNYARILSGEVGEFCVRPDGPNVLMNGYFNDPEATVRAFRNLWYHTGDLGRDRGGRAGRHDDLWRVGSPRADRAGGGGSARRPPSQRPRTTAPCRDGLEVPQPSARRVAFIGAV